VRAETYVKKYGGTVEEWEKTIALQKIPKEVGVRENGAMFCQVCGHDCKSLKVDRNCNYCGQLLTENRIEKLKRKLFDSGVNAIEDFLGCALTFANDDIMMKKMSDIAAQMPEEELNKFFAKYGIN